MRIWEEQELRHAERVWRAGGAPTDPAQDEGCCSCCNVLKSSCCFADPEDQEVDIEVGELLLLQFGLIDERRWGS